MSVSGKTAIVTGASRGIGHFIARELARAGANVVVAARSDEPHRVLPGTIGAVAEECRSLGANAIPVRLDVTDDASIVACVEQTIAEFGRIDLLVNNAGIMAPGPLHEVPMKRIDIVLAVNVRGPWAMSRAVIPHMLAQGGGVIVNISSGGADSRGAGNISYSLTKQADRKLAEGIAAEYAERGIRAYSLSPEGVVITPGAELLGIADRIPPDRREPEDLMGRAVIALFDDTAAHLNGQHHFSAALLRHLEGATP